MTLRSKWDIGSAAGVPVPLAYTGGELNRSITSDERNPFTPNQCSKLENVSQLMFLA